MWIKIKSNVIKTDELMLISFNDSDKSVVIYTKYGAMVVFGETYQQGTIPRNRVITKEEYQKIKLWADTNLKPEVVV